MRLLERIMVWLIQRKYHIHVRKSGGRWKVDLHDQTISTRTLLELEDILEELFGADD